MDNLFNSLFNIKKQCDCGKEIESRQKLCYSCHVKKVASLLIKKSFIKRNAVISDIQGKEINYDIYQWDFRADYPGEVKQQIRFKPILLVGILAVAGSVCLYRKFYYFI